jgi:hypothetical protein
VAVMALGDVLGSVVVVMIFYGLTTSALSGRFTSVCCWSTCRWQTGLYTHEQMMHDPLPFRHLHFRHAPNVFCFSAARSKNAYHLPVCPITMSILYTHAIDFRAMVHRDPRGIFGYAQYCSVECASAMFSDVGCP